MLSSDSFSRRTFLAATSGLALARGASSKDRLKAGLVGCGGRGTQAVVKLLTGNEHVDLIAIADGFDSFQKLINSDVDIVMLATPPGYRPQHFEAAVNAGKHVFTEKPIATDPVGVRRFLAAAKKAEEKKLTVMSGAQRHADHEYVETVDKIHNGAMGEIVPLNSYYLSGQVFHAAAPYPKVGAI